MTFPASSARLLIIDDDPTARTLAANVLAAAGFDVIEAGDGAAGLAQFRARRPELVLLDVMMPGMDGYEVCRALRAFEAAPRVPVIMLTGLDDTASIEKAFESGATDFFAKPINAALLIHRVRYALRTKQVIEGADRQRANLANAQRRARLESWVCSVREIDINSSEIWLGARRSPI